MTTLRRVLDAVITWGVLALLAVFMWFCYGQFVVGGTLVLLHDLARAMQVLR
jgi:hypothetical protein